MSGIETRKGLLTKLGILGSVAIALVVVGKKHIAARKGLRHKKESDALVGVEDSFDRAALKPGVPDEPSKYERESQFVGAGSSYSSRRPGDRLSMWTVFGFGK